MLLLLFFLSLVQIVLSHYSSPAVNASYRRGENPLDFYTQYPLSAEMMTHGLPNFSLGQVARFRNLVLKLSKNGQQVNIMALGGSFARGSGCCPGLGWPGRFILWLRSAYPHAVINRHDHCKGSTTSFYGAHVLNDIKKNIDLLLVGYAINDKTVAGRSGNSSLLSVTEKMVRQAYASGSAVLYLVEQPTYEPSLTMVEAVYQDISALYNTTVVSYRKAVVQNVSKAEKLTVYDYHIHSPKHRTFSVFWPCESSFPHPNSIAHELVTEMIAVVFVRIVELLQNVSAKALAASMPAQLPPPSYGSNVTEQHLHCHPPITLMSTLMDRGLPFVPFYQSPTERRVDESPSNRKGSYYRGWTFGQDIPSKPWGWISNSTEKTSPHIAFGLEFYSGKVSITYLSTYANAGMIEVWLSNADWSSNGASLACRGNRETLGCLIKDASKKALYPSLPSMLTTNSAFIDTFDNFMNISEIRTQTFEFSVQGFYVLNIRGVSMNSTELNRRNGDKVKILAIRSC